MSKVMDYPLADALNECRGSLSLSVRRLVAEIERQQGSGEVCVVLKDHGQNNHCWGDEIVSIDYFPAPDSTDEGTNR